MALPESGRPADELLETLRSYRSGDVRWQDGRTFGLVFDGGPEVHAVAEAATAAFLHDNALNTQAFPSLARIQSEVVEAVAALTHGGAGDEVHAAGFMTSGGTESILCAVKAARERGRAERGIERGNIVLPESAHAAFHKGAYYFGLEVRSTPVRDDWRADPDAVAAACDDDTVLVVGSAPQYPQGVIDPIADLAAIAADRSASFHTDACMGGFVLPFMEMEGHDIPPWDFRVPGVTSISADIHKLGYAPKGASVILHRTKELRRYQTFVFDGWLGGLYASPNLQGTRSAAPMAAAWAVMHHLGVDGYRALTRTTIATRERMVAGIRAVDGLAVLGEPEAHLVAMAAAAGSGLDIFAVGDGLRARGWYLDRQGPPDSLHATVSNGNAATMDEYLSDLADVVAEVGRHRTEDRTTTYATLE